MTDPASSVAGSVVATGVGAGVLSAFGLGLEAGPLFWSLVGASLGMSFASAASRFRATIVFVAVVLVCSLFGAWLAQRLFGGEQISRNALSCGLSIIFHPLLNAAITRVPAALDSALARAGLGSKP